MILWRNIEIFHVLSFPRFPPLLIYVRLKSGVTFVRRCFRDAFRGGASAVFLSLEPPIFLLHYVNPPIQYTVLFSAAKITFLVDFFFFCTKNRLWVHVNTATIYEGRLEST